MAPKKEAPKDQVLPPPAIEVAHAFGSQCQRLRDAVMFGDIAGQFLVHPVGCQTAFRHLLGNEVSFTVESHRVQTITAIAASRDRSVLAVCELCAGNRSQVSVYELGPLANNQPVQTLEELGGRDGPVGHLVCAAFSSANQTGGVPEEPNSKLCLGSDGDKAQLIILDWRLNEIIGRCILPTALDRIAFNLLDSSMVSGSNSSSLDLWLLEDFSEEDEQPNIDRLESKELRRLPEVAGLDSFAPTFADHAWIQPANGTLAACSKEGPIYILHSGIDVAFLEGDQDQDSEPMPYVICTIESPFGGAHMSGADARCIACFVDGFVVCGTGGAIAVWQLQSSGEGDDEQADLDGEDDVLSPVYLHVCTSRLSGASTVTCLDFVGDIQDGQLVVGFESANITHFSIRDVQAASGGEMGETPVISGGVHSGPVSCMDMAVQRPILVTASSQDFTVRVWDYHIGKCDLCWIAQEELSSVAIHPFGFFIAIGSSDRIRLMQILARDLEPFCEIPMKNVSFLRFSHGGHLLVAVTGKVIWVYSARNLKKLATLRGHPKDVTSISFDPDDKTLLSVSEDGRLCEWSTHSWNMIVEQPPQGETTAVVAGPSGMAWAGVIDAESRATVFRTYKNWAFKENDDIPLPTGQSLSAMSLCRSGKGELSVLAGDSTGNLRAFCSLTGLTRTAELALHSAGIVKVCISADGRTAATAGSDGAIFVLHLTGIGESQALGPPRPSQGKSMEVVMINRGEMQQQQDEIQELTTQTAALKAQLEEDAARLQSECRARVDEARRKDQERVQSLRLKYESLQQASTAKERENLRQMKAMESRHVQVADDKEKVYDAKMRKEADNYVAEEAKLRDLETHMEQARERGKREVAQQRLKESQELERQVAEKDREIQKVKDLISYTKQRFDAMLDQEGMEQGIEISDLKRKNQEELEQQHLVEYKLKKEQDTLLRGLDMMEKDRERIANEQREASIVVNRLKDEAEIMKREVSVLKEERKEREATLRDKEVEIGSHKLKVQTLKKFKHVLDYRLREVTESLQPKEEMIAKLHLQLGMLEQEFERQLEQQKQMEANLVAKTEQVADLTKQAEKEKEVLKQRERTILSYTADLHALATTETDTRNWHIGLKKIWRDHVDPESFKKEDEFSVPMQELGNQVKIMERKASLLESRGKISEDTCKADIIHKTEENFLLIHELDEIRVETKALTKQMKELELRVRQAEQRNSEQQAKAALPDAPHTAYTRPSSRQESQNLPQAVQDFFDEAPRARASMPKGQMVKASKQSVFHKSAAEIQQVKSLMRAAESKQTRIQMQRIEQKLLQDQLDSLTKKKGKLPPPAPTIPAPLESVDSTSTAPVAGGGLSAVRGRLGAQTPTSDYSPVH